MQRYTIRDLNTGQLYVLDGDEGIASPDDPASPTSGTVTDIIQGRQLSLDEFEQLLGLNAVLEVPVTALILKFEPLHHAQLAAFSSRVEQLQGVNVVHELTPDANPPLRQHHHLGVFHNQDAVQQCLPICKQLCGACKPVAVVRDSFDQVGGGEEGRGVLGCDVQCMKGHQAVRPCLKWALTLSVV